jgi:DNA-binding NarL/FixJ family response regulator
LPEASDGQEALGRVPSLEPDIAVMDISMPTLNGLNAARQMNRSSPKTKTILASAVLEAYPSSSENSKHALMSRERPVLALVAEGKSSKDGAPLLGISVKTAESPGTRLMHKLDIHETARLVLYALRHGIVQA